MSLIEDILLDSEDVDKAALRDYLEARDCVPLGDFGAVGNAVLTNSGTVTGTDDSSAFAAALSALSTSGSRRGRALFVPRPQTTDGAYRISSALILPQRVGIVFEEGACLAYDGSAGTHCLNLGTTGVRHYNNYLLNLYIELRRADNHGIDMLNCVSCYFAGKTRVHGTIDWDTWEAGDVAAKIALASGRTNRALRIRADADSFHNRWEHLDVSHAHTGVQLPAGPTVTQQRIDHFIAFGDAIYGDETSAGMVIQNGQGSSVGTFYIEGYNDTGGIVAGIQLQGLGAFGWSFGLSGASSFDNVNDSYELYGGGAITMNAIRISAVDGEYPSGNVFGDEVAYAPSADGVENASRAEDANYIGNNGAYPGVPFTTALRCATSGEATLTPDTGDKLLTSRRGNLGRAWGEVTISAVDAPQGRLFLSLPWAAVNNDASISLSAVLPNNLSGFTGEVVGRVNRNESEIEIKRVLNGVQQTDMATFVQATTTFTIDVTYTCAPL